MAFTVTIETDNEAFSRNKGREVARILRRIAERLERGEDSGKAMDLNGNSVGKFELAGD